MGTVVLVGILWLVAIGMLVIGKITVEHQSVPIRKYAPIPLLLGFGILLAASLTTVSTGEVGVPVAFGHAGEALDPGIHVVAPWVDVRVLSTKTANYTMDSGTTEGQHQGNDAVVAHTLDNADVSIDSSVLYHLPRSAGKNIISKTGTDYEEKVIRPTIRNIIGDVATNFNATDLASSKRSTFEAEVLRRLDKEFQVYGLQVEAVKVRKIELPQGIIDSINAKIKSTQDLLNLQVQLQQAGVNADIQRTIAKATADAQQIVACGAHVDVVGTKQTVIPNSKDHCDQTQLTPQYLQYIYIQTLQKIAESKSNSTVVIPFDSKLTPLLNVK